MKINFSLGELHQIVGQTFWARSRDVLRPNILGAGIDLNNKNLIVTNGKVIAIRALWNNVVFFDPEYEPDIVTIPPEFCDAMEKMPVALARWTIAKDEIKLELFDDYNWKHKTMELWTRPPEPGYFDQYKFPDYRKVMPADSGFSIGQAPVEMPGWIAKHFDYSLPMYRWQNQTYKSMTTLWGQSWDKKLLIGYVEKKETKNEN